MLSGYCYGSMFRPPVHREKCDGESFDGRRLEEKFIRNCWKKLLCKYVVHNYYT